MTAFVGMRITVEKSKKKMVEHGAVSPETAKTPEELDIPEWVLKSGIGQFTGIKHAEDRRYYVECDKQKKR